MPFCIDAECFGQWVYDESYWEMNESLRVCPDNTAMLFKTTTAPVIYLLLSNPNFQD